MNLIFICGNNKVLFIDSCSWQNSCPNLLCFMNNCVESIYKTQKARTKVLPLATVRELYFSNAHFIPPSPSASNSKKTLSFSRSDKTAESVEVVPTFPLPLPSKLNSVFEIVTSFLFKLTLKVRKFQKEIVLSLILPKKQLDMFFHHFCPSI